MADSKSHFGYVYMLAKEKGGRLYIGVTPDLNKRINQLHEEIFSASFGKFSVEYPVKHLVYYECFNLISDASTRKKMLKNWRPDLLAELIETENPEWNDLFPAFSLLSKGQSD